MPTPEPTSLTPQQQQRAEALAIVRRHFALPGGFTGMSREKLSAAVANPVIALAEWILEERPQPAAAGPVVVGDPAVPGSRERPLAYTDEVWTVDTALSANTTEAALRCWEVTPDGRFEKRTVEHLADDLLDQDPPAAEVVDDDAVRPNAGPCPICYEAVALPLLAGHLKLHEDTEETDRG